MGTVPPTCPHTGHLARTVTGRALLGYLALLLLLLAGCALQPAPRPSTLAHPTVLMLHHELRPETGIPTGVVDGELQATDGCLRIHAASTTYVPLWPAGWMLASDGTLRDADGLVAGTVGGTYRFGGGEVKGQAEADRHTAGRASAVCPAQAYWLVTEVLPPAP
jgi:hypothetical protein